MKYAIGEIVLVVIGILIALQINNWNTYKKDRLKEKTLLQGLVVNLELNKKLIKDRMALMDIINSSADLILKFQDKDLIFTDSLENTLFDSIVLPNNFFLPNQGFANLKSTGFDIILNENLRAEIIQLFEVDYNLTNIRFNNAGNRHLHQYQYIDENFKSIPHITRSRGRLYPYHIEKTLQDNYFFSIISSFKQTRFNLKNFLIEDLEKTEKLLMLLKESGY